MNKSTADQQALFRQLAHELQREEPRIRDGTIMNGRCLRVADEFLALVDYKGSGLVVKLSKERVAELIKAGVGQPFAPAGKVFKEWVSIPVFDRQGWLDLLHEGVARVTTSSVPTIISCQESRVKAMREGRRR